MSGRTQGMKGAAPKGIKELPAPSADTKKTK